MSVPREVCAMARCPVAMVRKHINIFDIDIFIGFLTTKLIIPFMQNRMRRHVPTFIEK
jgi:hypothetical protein